MTEPASVFLLTNTFPYGRGEEFLEAELPHLAREFGRVVIIACQPAPDSARTRDVPDNCVVLRARGERPHGAKALVTALRGAVSRISRGRLRDLRKPRHLVTDAMFEGRSGNALRSIIPGLDALCADAGTLGLVVIYSYWLQLTAGVALRLRDHLVRRGVGVAAVVSRAHGYDLFESRHVTGYLPERELLLDRLDAVFPISDAGTRHLTERHPRYASKVHTRRLGSADPGQLVRPRREAARLVSCSSIIGVKRVELLPAVVARVRAAGHDLTWTHVGSGPEEETVRHHAESHGVADACTFAGYVAHDRLADVYRDLAPFAFINVSSSEGIPVSIMEAISLGIPVVATDVGGVGEIVDDGRTGFLLPAHFTPEQAADALIRLLEMAPDDYRRMCAAARDAWASRYDEATNYAQFDAELRGLTSEGTR